MFESNTAITGVRYCGSMGCTFYTNQIDNRHRRPITVLTTREYPAGAIIPGVM